jgi:acyl-CoA thioester hydrolase
MSLPALSPDLLARPLEVHEEVVRPEWIDYNGHMNLAYYVLAFDHATDRFLDMLDLGIGYARRARRSTFVLETHVNYLREVTLRQRMRFAVRLLDADEKRLHYFLEMFGGDERFLAATSEQLALHVDLETRRSAAMPEPTQRQVAALLAAHRAQPRPASVGRAIGIRRGASA